MSSAKPSSLYPSIDMKDLNQNLIPEEDDTCSDSHPHEEILIKVPGVIVHLIEPDQSVELASGDITIVGLKQGDTTVAVLARVGAIQWPLAKDEAAVKLDESHYFFGLRVSGDESGGEGMELLNYGVTFASKGQGGLLREFDKVLEKYSSFSVEKVKEPGRGGLVSGEVAKGMSPEELESDGGKKKKMMEESSAAYWTVLAPNVDDYSSSAARLIAAGSGNVIRGILWCGDVTVDRLKWGDEFLKKRISKGSESAISPGTLRRIKRVRMLTKSSEKVALGILGGVVKVSGFFAGAIVNSKAGQKFCSVLPGEIVLASLDGFNKVCDALEATGKNVMSTSSVVTTGLVTQRYGEQAGKVTNESANAVGHALGTAWAVFKITKALNPKTAFKPTKLAKTAAQATAATQAKQKK